MVEIKELPVSDKAKELIKTSITNYRRFAKVFIEITNVMPGKWSVVVEQKEPVNGKTLTAGELRERVTEAFTGVAPDNVKLAITAITTGKQLNNLAAVDYAWIQDEMGKRNIKQADLCDMLNIDKGTISVLINGHKGLTKFQQAAFYYLFKTL